MVADFRAFLLQTDRPLQALESSGPQIGESMVPLAGRQELVEGPYGSARVRTGPRLCGEWGTVAVPPLHLLGSSAGHRKGRGLSPAAETFLRAML